MQIRKQYFTLLFLLLGLGIILLSACRPVQINDTITDLLRRVDEIVRADLYTLRRYE